ncbi:MAG: zinc-ribbon domain-containing protein [Atopobiaceae bacterium]|nr:zinc-ribbon domain-containing protein [Atopobiaceae bacterium]
MFCPQCGTQIPDGSTFCPNCGTRLSAPAPEPVQPEIPQPATYEQVPAQPDYQQQAFQPQAYEPSAYQQAYQQQASAYQQQPAAQQPPFQAAPAAMKGLTFTMPASIGELFCSYNKAGAQYAESTGLKMKWYKALTVALLYLVAAGNLFAGLQNIIGISYGESSSYLYSMYPGMRVLDIVYGIILIGMAFVALYVRMHLAQFKEDGPRLYLLMLLVNVCITAAFSLLTMVITGYYELSTVSGALLGGVIVYVLNRTYFGKRQHLFTM